MAMVKLSKQKIYLVISTITNQFEYDYQGRKIKETDANNNSNTYEYDCKGQLDKFQPSHLIRV